LGLSRVDDDLGNDHGALNLQEGLAMGPLEITGLARLVLGLATEFFLASFCKKAR
jgi:hypothetical protein